MTIAEDLLVDNRSPIVLPDESREDGLEDAVSGIVGISLARVQTTSF